MHDFVEQFFAYVKGAWRYRWWAVATAWLVCLVGWVVVYLLPNRFEATARVYVDTQSMLKPLMSGLAVGPNTDQQIAVMSRTLITRPNLEKVLRMADLDIKAKTSSDREQMIDQLGNRIEFKGAGNENLYSLAFWDRNPEQAKKVVQSLLTIFVESSLGDKRKDADTARRFIDEQIKAYEEKLVAAENALKEFKRKNMGLMPGDKQDYFTRLSQAGAQLNQARLELREAQNAREAIQKQVAGEEPVMLDDEATLDLPRGKAEVAANSELDARIKTLQQNLDQLRLKYTEQHPDIVGSRKILAQLEAQRDKEAADYKHAQEERRAREDIEMKAAGGKVSRGPAMGRLRNSNPVIQQLKLSLADTEAQVASMTARVAEYERRFNDMRAMADAVPQVEADFTQLNRDYEVNKANYEKLLARRESAQISENMESSAGGLDFRVIDPPRVPLQPSGPNRVLLASAVLLGGLLAGIGAAVVLSQVRPSFHDARHLRDVVGLPVLGSVSMIWTSVQQTRTTRGRLVYSAAVLALFGCYGAILGAFHFLLNRTAV